MATDHLRVLTATSHTALILIFDLTNILLLKRNGLLFFVKAFSYVREKKIQWIFNLFSNI